MLLTRNFCVPSFLRLIFFSSLSDEALIILQWATTPWRTQTIIKRYAFHGNAKIHPRVYHMSETAMLPDSNNHDFKLFSRWFVKKCISCV